MKKQVFEFEFPIPDSDSLPALFRVEAESSEAAKDLILHGLQQLGESGHAFWIDVWRQLPGVISIMMERPDWESSGTSCIKHQFVYHRESRGPLCPRLGKLAFEQGIMAIGRAMIESAGQLPPEKDFGSIMKWGLQSEWFSYLSFSNQVTARDHTLGSFDVHAPARWVSTGSNQMRLSEGLAASLLLTEPDKKAALPLKLPFPAVMVEIPPCVIPITLEGKETWISHMLLVEVAWQVPSVMALYYVKGNAAHLTASYFPCEGAWDKLLTEEEFKVNQALDPAKEVEFTPRHFAVALRVIDNLLSWLDASGGKDRRKDHKPWRGKKQKKLARKHGWPTIWLLGEKIKLSKDLVEASKDFARGEVGAKPKEGWKLRMQHVVRGHWKQQAYGPKNSLRKRVWVEPYMRGPEGDVAWSHVYEATGAET